MKKNVILIILFLSIGYYNLYSFSPKIESFSISNNSNKELIVYYEFWEENINKESSYSWIQKVDGLELRVRDRLSLSANNIVKANKSRVIIQYYPNSSLIESKKYYEEMNKIPFLTKINAIFKFLNIKSMDGKIDIFLDDLENMDIKKLVLSGETAYILEIFNYEE